jgi:hypothetical protein
MGKINNSYYYQINSYIHVAEHFFFSPTLRKLTFTFSKIHLRIGHTK